jgi:hypothetical protein
MAEMLRRTLTDPASQVIAWSVALAYLLLFQVAVADLTIDSAWRPASIFVVDSWQTLVLRTRAPFQFEAVAVAETPFLVWLVSPMNIAVGLALGLLTGVQVALVRIARHCAVSCGLKPAAGALAAVPGLLAGSACCAPILFVLLGVQVTASLITLMGLLIPAAFVFLLLGLGLTLRFAARRCAGLPA